ncbi:hypothetical protein Tco_1267538 [Tanacetum coccineum]
MESRSFNPLRQYKLWNLKKNNLKIAEVLVAISKDQENSKEEITSSTNQEHRCQQMMREVARKIQAEREAEEKEKEKGKEILEGKKAKKTLSKRDATIAENSHQEA